MDLTTIPQGRRRIFQAGVMSVIVGTAFMFAGVATATDPVAPTLLIGPACEDGSTVLRYEVTNRNHHTKSLTLTIGGVAVAHGVGVPSGRTVSGSVFWPAAVDPAADAATVASWDGTGLSTTLVSRGDMCSNPVAGLPSRGPSLLAGVACLGDVATVSFRLTNNDDAAHDMNLAVAGADVGGGAESVLWPSIGGTLTMAPGETVAKDAMAIPAAYPVGSALEMRGWWRTADATTYNEVSGVIPDCGGGSGAVPSTSVVNPTTSVPAATTTVPAPTTTVPAATTTVPAPTTTVPGGGPTTSVPAPTTTVPAATTTVPAPTTTVPAATTTVPGGGPTTTIPAATTSTPGGRVTTTTAPTPRVTVPKAPGTAAPKVGGMVQTPARSALAKTGSDPAGRSIGGAVLLVAGAVMVWVGRPRRSAG